MKKKVVSVLILLMFAFSQIVFAEELFELSKGVEKQFRWKHVTLINGIYKSAVKINGDNLSDTGKTKGFDPAVTIWNQNASTYVYFEKTNFYESKCDLYTASVWDEALLGPYALGVAFLYDTDGDLATTIKGGSEPNYNFDKYINYAKITINKDTDNMIFGTTRLHTYVHEMGHVLGLGHTGRTDSVVSLPDPSLTTPTGYDIAVLDFFYRWSY